MHQGINNVPRFSYWLFQDRLPLLSFDIYLTVSWLYCLSEDREGNILTLGIESIEFSLWFIQIILQQQQRTLCFSAAAAAEGDRRIQLVVYTHGVCYAIITFKDNSFRASLTLSESDKLLLLIYRAVSVDGNDEKDMQIKLVYFVCLSCTIGGEVHFYYFISHGLSVSRHSDLSR